MAKQQDDALFEESSRGKIGAGKVILFILGAVLIFGGMYVMSLGFSAALSSAGQFWVYTIGLVATIAGFAIPFSTPFATTIKIK